LLMKRLPDPHDLDARHENKITSKAKNTLPLKSTGLAKRYKLSKYVTLGQMLSSFDV
jgi:hypothetical protein